jgi:hypothetical protein
MEMPCLIDPGIRADTTAIPSLSIQRLTELMALDAGERNSSEDCRWALESDMK